MMKRGKRYLAMFLATAMTAACLTGCGGGEGGNKKNSSNKAGVDIEIAVWNSGIGIEWLENIIEGFEEKHPEYNVTFSDSSNIKTVNASLGMEDIDTADLYLTYVSREYDVMEPLDDILDATAEGDQKTLKEKFNATYLAGAQSEDGHYYSLTCGGGTLGMVYNTEMFEDAGITQLPRTTDELTLVCDTLKSYGVTPLCHFVGGGYYTYMSQVFMAQYDGIDYYTNNFYTCKDEAGNSPSKDVLTKKDGRYYALKAYEQFITPEYVLAGSNSKSHTEIQTEFLNDKAAMMFNGSWLSYEMRNLGSSDKFAVMKTPVLSSIKDKLSTINDDKLLRKVISAIDQIAEGKKQLSDYASGEDYKIGDKIISKADWEYVAAARNTVASNFAGQVSFIPTYSNSKEGAKEFLKYMYSDEGLQIYADTVQNPLPIALSTGEAYNTSEYSMYAKQHFSLLEQAENLPDMHMNKRHAIFNAGAADYVDVEYIFSFCTNNAGERMTAEQVWKLVIDKINDDYETNWLKNIK